MANLDSGLHNKKIQKSQFYLIIATINDLKSLAIYGQWPSDSQLTVDINYPEELRQEIEKITDQTELHELVEKLSSYPFQYTEDQKNKISKILLDKKLEIKKEFAVCYFPYGSEKYNSQKQKEIIRAYSKKEEFNNNELFDAGFLTRLFRIIQCLDNSELLDYSKACLQSEINNINCISTFGEDIYINKKFFDFIIPCQPYGELDLLFEKINTFYIKQIIEKISFIKLSSFLDACLAYIKLEFMPREIKDFFTEKFIQYPLQFIGYFSTEYFSVQCIFKYLKCANYLGINIEDKRNKIIESLSIKKYL